MKKFCFLLMATLSATVYAQKITIDGITYKIEKDNSATVWDSDKNIERANIQSSVSYNGKDYPVKKIGTSNTMRFSMPDVFYARKSLEYVSIPNSVKEIGIKSFAECTNIKELVMPDTPVKIFTLSVGSGSLYYTSAFYECSSLEIVRCHNGSIPAYAMSSIPKDSPFVQARRYGLPSNNSQYVQVPTMEQPVSNQPKKPSSDVDYNLPENVSNNNNTFAIIFANENYQEEVKVDFALNDGEMFKQYCNKVLGLPEENIHIKKDATLNNMKAELAWLQQVAKAYNGKARFIIYYAGHGIPDEKTGSSYLLPVDGTGRMLETGYSLSDFYQLLGALPSAGVTVFMDACFSGSKRGDGMLASARGVAIKSKPQAPKGKMVVFSAANGDETAYPFKEKEHGLFTYYLLKKLKDSKGNVTFSELASYLTEEVGKKSIVANGKSQTPTVVPSAGVTDWRNLRLK